VLTSGAGWFLRGLPRLRPLPLPRLGGIPGGGIDAGGEEEEEEGVDGSRTVPMRQWAIWRGPVAVLGAGPAGQ
jgi:hypothetical protein